jgi:membrane fusion protein (multidrug efflux system)
MSDASHVAQKARPGRLSKPSTSGSAPREIYRGEALDYYAHYQSDHGAPLRISPAWTGWAYWLLAAGVVAGLLFAVLGTVHEYAVGPAVTRVEGRTEITASSPGTVLAIHVRPGQRVPANELLVSLYGSQEAAEYERINRLYENQLVKTLYQPTDHSGKQELNALSTQRALAKARLDERSILAPQSGVVSDVRIRPGQHLQAGDVLFALNGDDAKWSVIAMLPGQYRPMLRSGATMRFDINGYRFAYRELTIDSVGDEVVGPSEVRRFLGQEIADTVSVHGPVVLVHAYLPSNSFTVDQHTYQYYEGLPGNAEARVNTESILLTLVPGLRQLFERTRDGSIDRRED